MHPPRFTFPHPEESPNSLKNIDLIITCLQDPKRLEIITPSLRDAENLIAHIGASIHPAVIAMVWESLKENKPLEKSPISLTTPTSKAIIREKETLVWHNESSTVCRDVTIQRFSHDTDTLDIDEESHLQVSLSRTPAGDVSVALEWEDGREADSTANLNKRWEKVHAIFKLLREEPITWDIRPYAVEKECPYDDDAYIFQKVRLYAALFPAELVELELEQEREAQARADQEAADGFDTERDDEEADWGSATYSSEFKDEDEDSEPSETEQPAHGSPEGRDPYTSSTCPQDESLTILSPSSLQISKIAYLSRMRVTTGIIEEVMQCTKTGGLLTPEAFQGHSPRALNDLAIHRSTTFTMGGALRTTHTYGIDVNTTVETLPDPALSISLSLETVPLPGEEPFLKSVFEWTTFSDLSTIQDWEEILRIAKARE